MLLFMPQHTGHKWLKRLEGELSKNCIRKNKETRRQEIFSFREGKNVIS